MTGDTRITAATDVTVNQPIVNGQSGSALSVDAGRDVSVNAIIDGRGGAAGGAVTLNASRNLSVNESLLTNNGSIGLTATSGAATVAAGKGLVSGTAPITMRSSGDLTTGSISGGSLSATSTGGSVRINGVIDGSTGRVDLRAASDVSINQPVLNLRTGTPLNVTAGRDILVNAQIDGRNGASGGAVSLNASRDVAINSAVVTGNGAIGITAATGAATMAAGTTLFSGTAPIAVTAASDVTTRGMSGGSLSATSTAGSVTVNEVIDGSTGRVDLNAARDVNINAAVLNTRSGASFTASAGQNVNVNAVVDGGAGDRRRRRVDGKRQREREPGSRHQQRCRHARRQQRSHQRGSGRVDADRTGAVALAARDTITTGPISGGSLTIASAAGSVAVNGLIDAGTGATHITAGADVNVNQSILNGQSGASLDVSAGRDVNLNAVIDGRGGIAGGAVTLDATRNVNLNESVLTKDGAIGLTAATGSVTVAAGKGTFAGSGPIAMQSAGDLTIGSVSGGSVAGDIHVRVGARQRRDRWRDRSHGSDGSN